MFFNKSVSLDILNNKQKIIFFVRKESLINNLIYSEDIQEYLGIKKSYASSLLTELESEGLIQRELIGRRKKIILTKTGRKITNLCFRMILSDLELNAIQNA
ncbi:MAG: helix-turn-helix transcriptional regulator [Candidatus Hodarchaeota archaeon]